MGWKKIFHAKGNQKKAGGVVITGKNEQHNCVFPDCNYQQEKNEDSEFSEEAIAWI